MAEFMVGMKRWNTGRSAMRGEDLTHSSDCVEGGLHLGHLCVVAPLPAHNPVAWHLGHAAPVLRPRPAAAPLCDPGGVVSRTESRWATWNE